VDGEVGQTLIAGFDFSPRAARQPEHFPRAQRQCADFGHQLAVAVQDVPQDIEIWASMRFDSGTRLQMDDVGI
jgi:hypothetical protein